MPSPAQVTAGRVPQPTGDYATDLSAGFVQTAPTPQNVVGTFVKNGYIPPGGFSKWAAALAAAKAGTSTATAAGIGASIIAGGTAVADVMTDGWWAQWRQDGINSGWPIHGDTLLPTTSSQYQSAMSSSSGFPFTYDAAPNATIPWDFLGPFTVPKWSTTVTLPLVHYTHPSVALGYNARSFRIFYFDPGNQDGGPSGSGATWHFNTDGANDTTVTLTGSNTVKSVDVTGLSNAAGHVLNFGNQSVGSVMLIVAIASYPTATIPTSGVHFAWFSMCGGFTLGDLARRDKFYPANRLARLIGTNSTAALFTPAAALSPPFAPDLAFIDVFDDINFPGASGTFTGSTPNFTVNGLPPGAYLHGLRRLVQALRRKSTGCDIVHHMPSLPDGEVSDINPGAANLLQNAWHYYKDQYEVAIMNGHGFVNTDGEWAELGNASGFLNASNPHPNKVGMTDIKARVHRLGL
jgi:hypothetical protein